MKQFNDNINIFIATHKKFTAPQQSIYIPMQVGVGEPITDYARENQDDNIAIKNPHFCELTVLYYIWKNIHTPIVGLVHYRRYFFVKYYKFLAKIAKRLSILPFRYPFILCAFTGIVREENIQSILKTNDCIIPVPQKFATTVREQYQEYHHIQDLDTIRQIIAEKYPDYLSAFDTMQQQNFLYYGNMFICKKEIINQYCAWLFDILFEAEKRIDISQYNPYNQRVFGFLSERLLSTWIIYHQNNFRFITLPVHEIKDKRVS